MVHCKWSALRESRWYEFAGRFALGGVTTCLAGFVADAYGPAVGGLFLAFPAVFCAGATMIETHERRRKREKGLRGDRRGREAAALDTAGAAYGSLGLCAFALAVWACSGALRFPLVLLAASVIWLAVSTLLWWWRNRFA